jgi:uncharacterized RDD family membrane protein YckC
MKCPKCGYLGFEPVERCRNCGYDFSLLPAIDLPDLSIREQGAREVNPLDDLALLDAAMTSAQLSSSGQPTPDLERVMGGPERQPAGDLLLFGAPGADDEPLITKASPPRPPLAVRRATPEVTKLRTMPVRAPMLDLRAADPGASTRSASQVAPHAGTGEGPAGADGEVAGLFARLTASAIDLVILAAIDLLVIYFTMQICGLDLADLQILPKGPLVTFLLVQNLGYLVVFTAGGQTLGKMAADIRVVSARPNSSLDLAHSIVRTLVWIVLAVPAGLGFLTALFSRDRRGLHDRCAGTRVVRASI